MALNTAQTFVESRYKSPIVGLCVDLESLRVNGKYSTPAASGLLGGYVDGFTKGYGHSYIDGQVSRDGDGPVTIVGNWRHDPGPLSTGCFEMTYDSTTKTMRGWWAETGDCERNEWVWAPATTLHGTIAAWVQSIAMARYTVACCQIYVAFTITQLLLALFEPPSSVAAQQWFNSIYSFTYLSFLVSYTYLQKKPAMAYMAGVFLYFLGYATFLLFYTMSSAGKSDGLEACYLTGSLLFLTGSVSLVAATLPPMQLAKLSPFTVGASLFWGSVSFLIGSVAFTWDAARVIGGNGYTPWLTKAGYAVFIVGRVYFVWGSVNPDVGIFLQRTPLKALLTGSASTPKDSAADAVKLSASQQHPVEEAEEV